ncbi:MAG: hypothetical protein KHZ24_07535 [Coriobacteriia bacterium]|nr:hypothetical protein [Coriobacteriia bacterium]
MFVQCSSGAQGNASDFRATVPGGPARVKVHNVQGSFSFSAAGGSSKSEVACVSATQDGDLAISGAVSRAFTVRLGDPCCSAVGPVIARAGVEGASVADLLKRAEVWEGANVVSFTSADGFVVRLPLEYVLGRASVVASRIGGVPVKESEGCANQLWIEGAPSHYAVRDVVRIGVERVPAAKVPGSPAVPLAGGAFAINPNIGVLNGILKGAQQGAIA